MSEREETIIVNIKPFITQIQKSACDTWNANDEKIYALPLGQLVEIALRCQTETVEGWSEKKGRTLKELNRAIQKVNDYQKRED